MRPAALRGCPAPTLLTAAHSPAGVMGGAGHRLAWNNAVGESFLQDAEDRAHAPAVGCSNAHAPTQVTITHPSSWRRAATAAGGCCYGRSPAFRERKANERRDSAERQPGATRHRTRTLRGRGPPAPAQQGHIRRKQNPTSRLSIPKMAVSIAWNSQNR